MSALTLDFRSGTLELRGLEGAWPILDGLASWDTRSRCFRSEAHRYADLLRCLAKEKIDVADRARAYAALKLETHVHRPARTYQKDALVAWQDNKSPGVVVLPTGAGKTHLGMMAIASKQRSTLVITPTLDLVRQWYDILRHTFACEVGLVGGGSHELRDLTVSTYDSAYLHMDHFGHRFGLVIFDECHHLPSGAYAEAARMCIAPFRLGLSATPERSDGKEHDLDALIGKTVFRRDIHDLRGEFLADYATERIVIDLSPQERVDYEEARQIYKGFIHAQGINLREPQGWTEFIRRSARSQAGQRAMKAYRKQREIAFSAPGKLDYLEYLLFRHRQDRVLIFTEDNASVYKISKRFLIPVITHQTKVKERSDILQKFADGTYSALATSKVLNEGVDVPAANVAIVLSGSGSVREHVQRLGRVLRPQPGKRALLYELVSAGTSETFTSQRRREHSAYR